MTFNGMGWKSKWEVSSKRTITQNQFPVWEHGLYEGSRKIKADMVDTVQQPRVVESQMSLWMLGYLPVRAAPQPGRYRERQDDGGRS